MPALQVSIPKGSGVNLRKGKRIMAALTYPFSLEKQPVLGYCKGRSSMNGAGRSRQAVAEKRQTRAGVLKPGSTRKLYDPVNQIIIGF
jgi:hypothetical protein